MKRYKILTLTASLLAFAGTTYAASLNFVGQDVGSPTLAGSATKNADGTIRIVGGGDDIWNASDNCYFYYAWASGQQWDTYVRVRDLAGPDAWTKCELMVRVSDPQVGPRGNDSFLAHMTTPDPSVNPSGVGQNQIRPQGRTAAGGSADTFGSTSPTPLYPQTWLRIIRNGSTFTLMSGTNSATFASVTWYTNTVIDTSKGDVAGGDNGTSFKTAFPDIVAVGVAVTAHNNGDVDGGIATVSDLTATFPGITPPTVMGATAQPQNVTNYAGSEASFKFVTTNNASPNLVNWPGSISYSWYKNGALIAGATSTAYTYLTSLADDGAQISAKATLLAPYNTSLSGLTSSTGTVKVLPALVFTNGLKNEVFAGAGRTAVENGNVGPGVVSLISSFDDPGGYGDYKSRRVSGYFIPPTTDTYTFFVAGDDDTDLFLSTDANPANKKLIAQEVGWSPTRNWLAQGGGGSDASKRSDQWTDTNGQPAWTTTTPLTAGQRYYIESVLYNGTGGDNLGVTYQTAAQMADPNWGSVFTNGIPGIMTAANKNIAIMTGPTTTLTITSQPQNASVFAVQKATFSVTTATDSELSPMYQWYRDGQVITNATSRTYTLVTGITDNGAKFSVVASTPVGGITVTSTVATLTVKTPVLERGLVKYERYRGAVRSGVENNTAGDPDLVTTFTSFEGPQYGTTVENFAARLSGLFIPQTTGRYVFFTCSDDDSDLFLSTDDNPANKRLIAQESGWSGSRNWTGVGGGSTPEQKRSDSWSPDGGVTTPYSAGIQLTAGQKYYIEAVMHDGTSGDNVSSTFKLITEADPTPGDATRLAGDLIGFYAPAASYVAFQQQPASTTVTSGSKVTLSGKAVSDSTISIAGDTNQLVLYQWFKNGTAIVGATSSAYTTPYLAAADTGVQYALGVRALGISAYSNSSPAVITVQSETVPPTLVSVNRSFSIDTEVIVTFSEPVDPATAAVAANYKINSGAIAVSAAALQADGKSVLLTTAPIAKGTSATLAVTGVKDLSLNVVAAGTQMAVGIQRGALFIAGDTDPAAPNANDTLTINHLKARGYDLQIVGANGDDVSMATDKNIVIISSSVSSGNVTGTYKDVPVPVIEWEQAIQDDMAMTTVGGSADRGTTTGQTTLEIVDPTHPLAAGLPAGPVVVTTSGVDFAWGQPAATANKVAKLAGTAGNFGIYGYDKGATMTDATAAPERRVLFFMTDNAPSVLNATGWALFDAAIDWAQGLPVTPIVLNPKLSATVSGGNLVISWAPAGGTLQSTTALGGTWNDEGTANPATIQMTGTAKFFRVSR